MMEDESSAPSVPFQASEKELVAMADDCGEQGAAETSNRLVRFVFGIAILILVVLLWVGSSVLTQTLYSDYQKPTALTTLFDSAERLPHWVLVFITVNWFICQWTFNISLAYTAVSTNTILSSSSVVWTYLFGLLIRTTSISIPGALCVVFAMSGVGLAVFGSTQETKLDPNAPTDSFFGEALATCSAMSYGVFSIALKKLVRTDQMPHLWGAVGVYSLALGAMIMLIGHITRLEFLEVPSMKDLGIILFNGFLGTSVSDFLWAEGVLLTAPLVATVCLNLTIPLSMLVDTVILKQHTLSWTVPLGAVLVFCGVVAAGIDETRNSAIGLDDTRAASLAP
eukprot:CAMPEP_0169386912 /NCGR_PEP_ID=MMETSP1017-20121227/45053_1 /TAXON_ID=342587 /ORGANISM="Karlodinium micrum, Strain CCMP2283" /LENGTH=338 /DNA_ID=CAMNT_0009488247 /DNA_START=1 /DNA_END=1014 /DNA_ORIENTATION=+